ncbi:MAG: 50S ribosomal protein L5 [Candidatus Woesearchaeota archaeon]|jgi:large subunit ribosomal protein L5|nr:50S ribosomal protein L5 [Candidatus Woesearchaeota archaeon]
MQNIRIEKVTLNIGAGKDQKVLERGIKLIKNITGTAGVTTFTNKRIPTWGIRPGLPIGTKLTIRKGKVKELLTRLLAANGNKLRMVQFNDGGNVSFGIKEYIDIPGVEYDPDIGVMGLEVSVTLEKPGFRIKRRHILRRKIPKKQQIKKEDAMSYMKKEFAVEVEQ